MLTSSNKKAGITEPQLAASVVGFMRKKFLSLDQQTIPLLADGPTTGLFGLIQENIARSATMNVDVLAQHLVSFFKEVEISLPSSLDEIGKKRWIESAALTFATKEVSADYVDFLAKNLVDFVEYREDKNAGITQPQLGAFAWGFMHKKFLLLDRRTMRLVFSGRITELSSLIQENIARSATIDVDVLVQHLISFFKEVEKSLPTDLNEIGKKDWIESAALTFATKEVSADYVDFLAKNLVDFVDYCEGENAGITRLQLAKAAAPFMCKKFMPAGLPFLFGLAPSVLFGTDIIQKNIDKSADIDADVLIQYLISFFKEVEKRLPTDLNEIGKKDWIESAALTFAASEVSADYVDFLAKNLVDFVEHCEKDASLPTARLVRNSTTPSILPIDHDEMGVVPIEIVVLASTPSSVEGDEAGAQLWTATSPLIASTTHVQKDQPSYNSQRNSM